MQRCSSLNRKRRRGVTLILSAVLLVVLLSLVAFAVDLGFISLTRTQLQVAADVAALAGAGASIDGRGAAEEEAIKFAAMHLAAGKPISRDQVAVRFGRWDRTDRRFLPDPAEFSAIEVTVTGRGPLFFGRMFNQRDFGCQAQAVATFAPRDIMLVLDLSGSMCFDSQLRSIKTLGRGPVEANLLEIYTQLGSPKYGKMVWTPQYIASSSVTTVKKTLGLNTVSYPYPGDSWDAYIKYVMEDREIKAAGYQKKYGYLTWVNYLQAKRCMYSQTPDLWKTSEQPITALKDAVHLLAAYLQDNCQDDRLGLVVYTAADTTAKLESSMTHDFQRIADIARRRQAGHYHNYTNISAGMKKAREEFQRNARTNARKVMVLMTDGQANLPGNSATAKRAALDEAHAAANAGIPIVTIALGADADTDLMNQIADITKGVCFIIPGGQSVDQCEEQLKDVFRRFAANRNLVLVQ